MGVGQTLTACSPQTRWLLGVVCVCVGCLQCNTGASAAAWATQPVSGPALVANGALSSVSCVLPAPCVAVGYFVSPSGADRPLIEIRTGRRWSIEANAVPPGGGDAQLNAVVCPAKRSCIAVGFSVLASGTKVPLAERWNGSRWSIQQTIDPTGSGGQLSALSCLSARFCMAVGSGPGDALVERWNGSRWSLQQPAGLGAASAGQLEGVSCPSRGACVAVGSARRGAVAEAWNGRRWSRFPGPHGAGILTAISCTSPRACSAISDTNTMYAVQRWNGQRWTKQNVSDQACDPTVVCSDILSAITCVSPSACYLAGALDFAATGSSGLDRSAPVAESWHGSRWHPERVTDIGGCPTNFSDCGNSLNGISCTARSVCVTVGTYSNAASVGQPLIEHRNSGAWTVQAAPSPVGPASSQLNAVSCSSSTACTAVGFYTNASGRSFLLAERWNGATWTIQPAPGTGELSGVSCTSATACTAVGATPNPVYPTGPVAESWNGATWTAMQTPGARALNAVSCTSTTSCVAVGQAPGGSALTESWNGATWTVHPGAGGAFSAGISCGSTQTCVAAGQDAAGDIAAASWDGTSWTPLPQPQPQFVAPNPSFAAFSCSAANACTVVVNNLSIKSQFQSSIEGLAFRWGGATWSTEKIQLPAEEQVGTIGGVACPSATTCTAVGAATIPESNGNLYGLLLERWDGTTWSAQPSPYPFQSAVPLLNGVSCASVTTCTAVGERAITLPTGNALGISDSGYSVPYVLSYS